MNNTFLWRYIIHDISPRTAEGATWRPIKTFTDNFPRFLLWKDNVMALYVREMCTGRLDVRFFLWIVAPRGRNNYELHFVGNPKSGNHLYQGILFCPVSGLWTSDSTVFICVWFDWKPTTEYWENTKYMMNVLDVATISGHRRRGLTGWAAGNSLYDQGRARVDRVLCSAPWKGPDTGPTVCQGRGTGATEETGKVFSQ